MTDASFSLKKFSPLRTPHVYRTRAVHKSEDGYVSSSSIESSVTKEIISISQSVQKKLDSDKKRTSLESSPEKGSGGSLFITQKFCEQVSTEENGTQKARKKMTKPDSENSAVSSESDTGSASKFPENKRMTKKESESPRRSKNLKSSSSSSDSSDSDMDETKYQTILERLKAKKGISDPESEPSPKSVKFQGAKHKEQKKKDHSDSYSQKEEFLKVKKMTRVLEFPQEQDTDFSKNNSVKVKSKTKVEHDISSSEAESSESDVSHVVKPSDKTGSPIHYKPSDSEQESDAVNSDNGEGTKSGNTAETPTRKQLSSDSEIDSSESENSDSGSKRSKNQSFDSDSDNESNLSKSKKISNIAGSRSSDRSSENDDKAQISANTSKVKGHKLSSPSKVTRQSAGKKLHRNSKTQKLVSKSEEDSADDESTISSSRKITSKNIASPETQEHSLRQSKIIDYCKPKGDTPTRKDSRTEKKQLRFKAPGDFETDDQSDRYATEKEVKGRQLFLIQTPVDFNISVLDNKKIELDGVQTICVGDETEKQYDLICGHWEDNQGPGYTSVVCDGEQNYKLGENICGQIQVLDWIPGIQPVKIEIPQPLKHRVPDNLKIRNVPFGSNSPVRVDTSAVYAKKAKRKHEKSHSEGKKKKKKKEKKELFDL